MLRDFNILATTEQINEGGATSELWVLLRAAGDEKPVVDRMGIWGLVSARTSLDPVAAVAGIEEALRSGAKKASALLRVMPVQRVVPTEVDKIAAVALELAATIPPDASFKVSVEKRRTTLGHMEVIDPIAEKLSQKVNLDSPDWVILVEICGKVTGISVVKPSGILNVQRLNYQLASEAKKRAALNEDAGQGGGRVPPD